MGMHNHVTATATDAQGNTSEFSSPFITGVTESKIEIIPISFSLSQNYPNPFNLETTIRFEIPYQNQKNLRIELRIYNLRGELMRTLVNEEKSPGTYQLQWDGTDQLGNKVVTGIYLYRIRAGEFIATKKMILMK